MKKGTNMQDEERNSCAGDSPSWTERPTDNSTITLLDVSLFALYSTPTSAISPRVASGNGGARYASLARILAGLRQWGRRAPGSELRFRAVHAWLRCARLLPSPNQPAVMLERDGCWDPAPEQDCRAPDTSARLVCHAAVPGAVLYPRLCR